MKRRVWLQIFLLLIVAALLVAAVVNAQNNLAARNIPTSFAFLSQTAGFGLNQSVIAYSPLDTYGRALLVGLLNTLIVSALSSVLATVLGFAVGFARLSPHWALSRLGALYVETLRNIPLLLHLLFWYVAILAPLPGPERSLSLAGALLNNRGLYLPCPGLGFPAFDAARNAFNVEGGLRLAPEAAAMIFALTSIPPAMSPKSCARACRPCRAGRARRRRPSACPCRRRGGWSFCPRPCAWRCRR